MKNRICFLFWFLAYSSHVIVNCVYVIQIKKNKRIQTSMLSFPNIGHTQNKNIHTKTNSSSLCFILLEFYTQFRCFRCLCASSLFLSHMSRVKKNFHWKHSIGSAVIGIYLHIANMKWNITSKNNALVCLICIMETL